MRYPCSFCGKSVSSELPDDAVLRAILVCPECIEAKRILIPEDDDEPKGDHDALVR
jgi:DNA-directed RNA polymerase subunit RPC12/RpoP